jgi:hypothetical protein
MKMILERATMHPLAEAYLSIRDQISQMQAMLEKRYPRGQQTINAYYGSDELKDLMKKEIALRERLCQEIQSIGKKTVARVADVLSNWENTSDDELREVFVEWGLTTDQCDWCIAIRAWFLADPFAEF